ncbi:DNA-dependent RNA polymerase subunit epsilon [Oceanobacillus senegalensis]|uniref:DNA-dependent RNA polymerase subunit epsilon n=1 Tax=Oceanobacillus senegalensis TaxID=1936063 RepID=UPI000A30621F|nr:DNA-directed RNA polymerase subunit epsilon [Oceanobacillus senegalensis]
MIFKILYQEIPDEIPVRERTKCLYVEAETVREVRQVLIDKGYNINIEYIQQLDSAHLDYEKQSEKFKVENA